jgi:hypothetical protein
MELYNHDVYGLIRRARRFRYETVKAASSNLASVSTADFGRAKSFLNALNVYLDWIENQPQLDLPESAPNKIEMDDTESLPMPENEAMVDLMNLYNIFEIEAAHCQSSRQGSGVISHDMNRFRAVIDKMDKYLDSYVATILPLDVPESSPKRAMTGSGRTGV